MRDARYVISHLINAERELEEVCAWLEPDPADRSKWVALRAITDEVGGFRKGLQKEEGERT